MQANVLLKKIKITQQTNKQNPQILFSGYVAY